MILENARPIGSEFHHENPASLFNKEGSESLHPHADGIGKSELVKGIISTFHRRLLLNLRLWRVSDCEELVGVFHKRC